MVLAFSQVWDTHPPGVLDVGPSLPLLPLEILYRIIEYASLKDRQRELSASSLSSLSRTCKRLNYPTTRWLYRNVAPNSLKALVRFTRTIKQNAELAALVQRLDLPLFSVFCAPPYGTHDCGNLLAATIKHYLPNAVGGAVDSRDHLVELRDVIALTKHFNSAIAACSDLEELQVSRLPFRYLSHSVPLSVRPERLKRLTLLGCTALRDFVSLCQNLPLSEQFHSLASLVLLECNGSKLEEILGRSESPVKHSYPSLRLPALKHLAIEKAVLDRADFHSFLEALGTKEPLEYLKLAQAGPYSSQKQPVSPQNQWLLDPLHPSLMDLRTLAVDLDAVASNLIPWKSFGQLREVIVTATGLVPQARAFQAAWFGHIPFTVQKLIFVDPMVVGADLEAGSVPEAVLSIGKQVHEADIAIEEAIIVLRPLDRQHVSRCSYSPSELEKQQFGFQIRVILE